MPQAEELAVFLGRDPGLAGQADALAGARARGQGGRQVRVHGHRRHPDAGLGGRGWGDAGAAADPRNATSCSRATVWWGWRAAGAAPWKAGSWATGPARARVGGRRARRRVCDRVRVELDLEIVVFLLVGGCGGGLCA